MTSPKTRKSPSHLVWVCLAIAVALGYLFGLGGDHIPRIGDELVYSHIAHLTAETGRWLPLVSSYDYMRNTKPPLLFWQAMVAGGWAEEGHWTLLRLRLPSLAYTWGIALMVGLLTCRIVRADALQALQRQAAPLAAATSERQREAARHHHDERFVQAADADGQTGEKRKLPG